jgi:hypothetical protein
MQIWPTMLYEDGWRLAEISGDLGTLSSPTSRRLLAVAHPTHPKDGQNRSLILFHPQRRTPIWVKVHADRYERTRRSRCAPQSEELVLRLAARIAVGWPIRLTVSWRVRRFPRRWRSLRPLIGWQVLIGTTRPPSFTAGLVRGFHGIDEQTDCPKPLGHARKVARIVAGKPHVHVQTRPPACWFRALRN